MADDALTRSISQAVRRPEVIEALCRGLEASLREQLGGGEVYIAKRGDRESMDARNEAIKAEFDGRNLNELARARQLTPRQVRRILKKKE